MAACLLIAAMAWGKPPEAGAPGPVAAGAVPSTVLDGPATLRHLNQAVNWYRHVVADIPALGLSTEVIYQDQAQSLGAQVVRVGFQSARSGAELLKTEEAAPPTAQASGGPGTTQQRAQAEARTAAKVLELQTQVDALKAKLAGTPGARRDELEVQLERIQSQLELQQALLDAIRKMKAFAETNGAGGLQGSIEQLAHSIPEAFSQASEASKPPHAGAAHPPFSSSGGLLSQLATLYDCMNVERQLDSVNQRTQRLREQAELLRGPLRTALRATIQESQHLTDQPLPAEGDKVAIHSETLAERALTERFKALSGTLIPLSQQVLLLDDCTANLGRWRDLVKGASGFVLRSVLLRVAVILLALGLILVLSETWRRVTFRYVKEPRRRRQFLVLRRVVSGFFIMIVLTLGFVTEFSSLATFAGFITAGIAVGLQAVLLSVAAYFLIIGRYGIRVGDRISIAGITGDVVDVGLVRLYILELSGTGSDFRPTGRIVVLSNSVLFQASTPLFRQVPGAEYAWHEVVVAVTPEGNQPSVQAKLLAAVEEVHAEHRPEFERQHGAIESRIDIQLDAPRPEARLQFADQGLELLVRYPVALRREREIDEQVTRKLLALIGADPELKAAVAGHPKIRSLLKG